MYILHRCFQSEKCLSSVTTLHCVQPWLLAELAWEPHPEESGESQAALYHRTWHLRRIRSTHKHDILLSRKLGLIDNNYLFKCILTR